MTTHSFLSVFIGYRLATFFAISIKDNVCWHRACWYRHWNILQRPCRSLVI